MIDKITIDMSRGVFTTNLKGTLVVGYSKGTVRVVTEGDVTEELFDLSAAVTSTIFTPNGRRLFACDALGTLTVYPGDKDALLLAHSMKHMVAKGGHRAPQTIAVCADSRLVAFPGPTEHCVTVLDTDTLNCLLKLDVGSAVSSCLDSVASVTFGTVMSRDLFVCTVTGRVLRVDSRSGVIVSTHQPFPSGPPLLLATEYFVLAAAGRHFKLTEYGSLSTLQRFIAHDTVTWAALAPGKLVIVGDVMTVWSVDTKSARTVEPANNSIIAKEDDLEEGKVDEHPPTPQLPPTPQPPHSPVEQHSPTGSLVNEDTTLYQTVDIDGYEREGYDEREDHGALVIEEETEDDGEAGALPPLNGRHPFKLSPEVPSPISPEPSLEPPRSLKHIKSDIP
eukprot:sb/3465499/